MTSQSATRGTLLEELARGKTFSQDDLFVPVMGPTGAGKSTFISKCTGEKMKIGHGIVPCTQEVGVATTAYQGRKVHLIDTPGFDDTYKQEIEILREIATWLLTAFKADIKLSGVIYLHPISHARVGGSAFRNMRTFKKMFGTDNMSCVVLATTFWENVTQEEGERRETELETMKQFWGEMRAKGSIVMRHSNDRNSAVNILHRVLEQRIKFTMAIQEQMGAQGVLLDETDAGQELNQELLEKKKEMERRLKLSEEETQHAIAVKDEEYARERAEDQKRYQEEIKKREEAITAMPVKTEDLLLQKEKAFQEQLAVTLAAARERSDSESMILAKKNEELSQNIEKWRQDYANLQRLQNPQTLASDATFLVPEAEKHHVRDMVASQMVAGAAGSLAASILNNACVMM